MGTRTKSGETDPRLASRPPVTPINRQRRFGVGFPRPLQVVWALSGGSALVLVVLGINMLLSPSSPTVTLPAIPTPTPPAIQQVKVPPRTFAPGLTAHACIRYSPLRGNQHHIVFLDPGHGGADSGASGLTTGGRRIYEKDVMLAVALAALPMLRDNGYTVVLSRNADTSVTLMTTGDSARGTLTATAARKDAQGRVACANTARAQALIVMHLITYADPAMNGAETIFDSTRPFSTASQRLANLVQQHVLAQFRSAGWPVPDRGVADDRATGRQAAFVPAPIEQLLEIGPSGTGWLHEPSTMPGALTYPLFISHPAEADVATDPKGIQAMATGITAAVGAFFNASAAGASATP